MQYFQDTATGQIYGYDDNVTVKLDGGISTVTAIVAVQAVDPDGKPTTAEKVIEIAAPLTLQSCAEPVPPAPTIAERASIALGAGLTIKLSGSIKLPATVFPVDPDTQSKIGLVVTSINATGSFPGGAESYPMKDAGGEWHTFTVVQYKAVAAAIAAYAAPLILIMDGNPFGATELPASSVSLSV